MTGSVMPRPLSEIAARLDIPAEAVIPYGRHAAKIDIERLAPAARRPPGRLILVSAITPTPAGEGKTTVSIGLADGLARIGKRVALCLREPSLGPVFGSKGGATGGGMAQLVPHDVINLHLTGDFHAIAAANNLLAAMVDNHLYWGNALGLDPAAITWRRAIDMNDRALREIELGSGRKEQPGRQGGFDITAASEVMAILCVARNRDDLVHRLGNITIGRTVEGRLVRAAEINAHGAMAALLRDAIMPNLLQTREGTPAFIHGGPFANIAHGCNSLIATRLALSVADMVVTEAGFGSDLGAEKFCDIKCRIGDLAPAAAVLVTTVRALKMHGGVPLPDLARPDQAALVRGFPNLARHAEILGRLGLPPVIAINRHAADSDEEIAVLIGLCADAGHRAIESNHWTEGGAGAQALARAVAERAENGTPRLKPLYDLALPLADKVRVIARDIYGAADVTFSDQARQALDAFTAAGFGGLPVCVAKTQFSFTADPAIKGAPQGHILPVREARLSAGAGFVVMLAGEIVTMPGLPRHPAAERVGLSADGTISGLA